MSTYLYDEDRKMLCDTTTRARLILCMVSRWRMIAAQERATQRQHDLDAATALAVAEGQKLGYGYGDDYDPLHGQDCVLPRAFELANVALPETFKLTAHEVEAYGVSFASANENYPQARLFIKERAADKKLVYVS